MITVTPGSPLTNRAQELTLERPDRSLKAWIAHAERSDLAPADVTPAAFLSSSELAQLSAFRFAPRQESFLLGRLAAKAALGAYFAEPDWTKIELSAGVFGQPLVHYPPNHGADIAISHVPGFAVALAFPRAHPMAVDLEDIDDARADTVSGELRFSPEELAWLQSPALEKRAAYISLWTAREALSKVLKCGLTCPFEILALDRICPVSDGILEGRYRNFSQYKCLSRVTARRVFSIVLPTATDLNPLRLRLQTV